jgi:glycosyltransferase involved in cell wall biosynthesis
VPPRVLLVVSADRAAAVRKQPAPRKDYQLLAETLPADVVDLADLARAPLPTRLIARLLGKPAGQAWLAFGGRNRYDAVLTDGEHIGLPLAVLLKLARARTTHVTIGHRVSAGKKRAFFRWLRVQTHIDRLVLHATRQYELAATDLSVPAKQLVLLPYQVDTSFWRPLPVVEERLVSSAGLELRDYPTLMRAVSGLDAQVVIGAASHWSKRANTATGDVPPNVRVESFDYAQLRELYARSALVVVPLFETDFQAGITTILEAMAMGKPVVVTHTEGQTDIVEDRRHTTRGAVPRRRPPSMLRPFAERAGVDLEPTGLYVLPNDPDALRQAIEYLLDHPEERHRLGAAGRRTVEALMTVEQFADRVAAVVRDACTAHAQQAGGAARDRSLRNVRS